MRVLEIENFTTLEDLLKCKKQNTKGGQVNTIRSVKNLEVRVLALNMEESAAAHYPEMHKEKNSLPRNFSRST